MRSLAKPEDFFLHAFELIGAIHDQISLSSVCHDTVLGVQNLAVFRESLLQKSALTLSGLLYADDVRLPFLYHSGNRLPAFLPFIPFGLILMTTVPALQYVELHNSERTRLAFGTPFRFGAA